MMFKIFSFLRKEESVAESDPQSQVSFQLYLSLCASLDNDCVAVIVSIHSTLLYYLTLLILPAPSLPCIQPLFPQYKIVGYIRDSKRYKVYT